MVAKAVILDRDGVINHAVVIEGKPFAPRKVSDFIILPGVEDAIVNISGLGYLIVVVTNQPDINNNLVGQAEVDAMHKELGHLPIERIYVCPHRRDEFCACRKPKPGMLFQARDELDLDLSKSFMVGDRQSDMEASNSAGCISVFIDYKYKETSEVIYDFICRDLGDFYKLLMSIENVEKSKN